ncbi:putative reverse transcriptase domain-containing protein [Tanacetum coccineum]
MGHLEKDCRVRLQGAGNDFLQNVTCFGCGEKGHFKDKCPKSRGTSRNEGTVGDSLRGGSKNPSMNPNVGHGNEVFDVIIVMDWLAYHRALIDCYEKIVRIPLPNGKILEVQGERPEKDIRSLACLPLVREIEFRIDLIPGASPVIRSPYRLAPSEMLELANQLKELQEKKGLITKSLTMGSHPCFFVKKKDAISMDLWNLGPSASRLLDKFEDSVSEDMWSNRDGIHSDPSKVDLQWSSYSVTTRSEIKYHSGKANVVADALSRKERLKPRRVRAMSITIHSGLKTKILEAQSEASKDLKAPAEWLRGLERHFEQRDDGEIYFFDRIWIPSVGGVRKLIMDEAHTSRYSVHSGSRQKGYADKRRKLAPRYVGPFEIVERVGPVAYRLKLPQELSCVHDTFHVSNLKKCLAEPDIQVPLDEIEIDENLRFVEEPIEIVERDVKKLKRRRIPLVKVRWNSRQGVEYTWEHEDQFRMKYPHLFS